MKAEGDDIIFSTGTRKYANDGIIGIDDDLEVTEGYDGGFYWYEHNRTNALTKEEHLELADFMIDRWSKFKSLVG